MMATASIETAKASSWACLPSDVRHARSRTWTEAFVKLRRQRLERVIRPAPADVGHQHYTELVLRLQQGVSQVHLVRSAVKQERLTREPEDDREPAKPIAAERGRAGRGIRSWR